MKNIIFISSHVPGLNCSTLEERKSSLRNELFTLGLEFYSVKIEGIQHFMVVTKNLGSMMQIAKEYNQKTFYISDSRRQAFRLDLNDDKYLPTKLGTLKRSVPQESVSSNPTGTFLSLTVESVNYEYNCV